MDRMKHKMIIICLTKRRQITMIESVNCTFCLNSALDESVLKMNVKQMKPFVVTYT